MALPTRAVPSLFNRAPRMRRFERTLSQGIVRVRHPQERWLPRVAAFLAVAEAERSFV